MSAAVVLQTLALTVLRGALFFTSRHHILRTLEHDLQDLAPPPSATHGAASSIATEDDLELEVLPVPSSVGGRRREAGGRKLHTTLARSAFSSAFAESSLLFLLLIAQSVGLLSSWARALNWTISLTLLLFTITLFAPLSISLTLFPSQSSSRASSSTRVSISSIKSPKTLLALVPPFVFLVLLARIPLPPALNHKEGWTFQNVTLARLVVLGTPILGALSGFGAVRGAWGLWTARTPLPTEAEVKTTQDSLARVRDDLKRARKRAQRSQTQDAVQAESSTEGGRKGWIARMGNALKGDEDSQELAGLVLLEHSMASSLVSLERRRAEAVFASTLGGRAWNVVARVWGGFCVIRIGSSLFNLLFPSTQESTNYPDLLARLLSLLPATQARAEAVARQAGLVLVGLIIASSVRLVLRGAARALRVTSRARGTSLMLLVLTQLMGIYLLTTLVSLRTSFPPPLASPDGANDNLFADIPAYEVFGTLFDAAFMLAAAVTLAWRYIGERLSAAS